ncbi:hypothetical protein PUNSTDRAFT_102600 [Punctularia strigosozonata HHB-11173 SS5]|uniref:uncharacterized protein n=1 Tax=Punctularia strigosozonata (strain HHB-11173) TaxID=741275 RepID=UPI0004417215|nr:uncharacterized protein PUNSTDRAFT_102600 [Punctularia strigosozonata HHB-11173 SS5]EIN09055.1 hypothetical protein PUNSTDRAFT_102600 [Punctularia strigosozonata HHB-11173 SS5]
MVKSHGKSSATSGTRKKHARKAAGEPLPLPLPKDGGKGSKKDKKKNAKNEPRKKVYIPPVKPAPVRPDPLDTLGLAHTLPPELLVPLRNLRKKDAVTKARALEDLQANWVDVARKRAEVTAVIVEMLPVWLHHLPSLLTSASRRVRLLAAGLHDSLLRLLPAFDALLFFFREAAAPDHLEALLGTWCAATHDVDRQVALQASRSWAHFVSASSSAAKHLDDGVYASLLAWTTKVVLDPGGAHAYLNPVSSVAPSEAASPVPQRGQQQRRGQQGSGRAAQQRPGTLTPTTEGTRAKSEADEEKGQDRDARLRIGGLGALGWIINSRLTVAPAPERLPEPDVQDSDHEGKDDPVKLAHDLLSNPALWTALYHGRQSPALDDHEDLVAFGFEQPGVRRAAWGLLSVLLRSAKHEVESLLPVLSPALLRAAWTEPDALVRAAMWEPLLVFLQGFPQAWLIEASPAPRQHDVNSDSGSDDDDGEHDVAETNGHTPSPSPSRTWIEFLQFLALGCSGSPLQGYPVVVLVLSTIPPSLLRAEHDGNEPFSELFTAFWAALDGGALVGAERQKSSAAFIGALLECILFLSRRALRDGEGNSAELARALVATQFGALGRALVQERRLRVDLGAVGQTVGKALVALDHMHHDLFDVAWQAAIVEPGRASEPGTVFPILLPLLLSFREQFEEEAPPMAACRDAVLQLSGVVLGRLMADGAGDTVADIIALEELVRLFADVLFAESDSASVDNAVQSAVANRLAASVQLLLTYIARRNDAAAVSKAWNAALSSMVSYPQASSAALFPLFDAARSGKLPSWLKPEGVGLASVVESALSQALEGSEADLDFLKLLLVAPDHFVPEDACATFVDAISATFVERYERALHGTKTDSSELSAPLQLLHPLLVSKPKLVSIAHVTLFRDVFVVGHVLSGLDEAKHARELWGCWWSRASEDRKVETVRSIKDAMHALLVDTASTVRAQEVLLAAQTHAQTLNLRLFEDIFPSRAELDAMLGRLPATPLHVSLGVVDPLVPPNIDEEEDSIYSPSFDVDGFSSYARVVSALLDAMSEDRQLARTNIWALRHLLALGVYAHDALRVPGGRSPVFSSTISSITIQNLATGISRVSAYLLSPVTSDDAAFANILGTLLDTKPSPALQPAEAFVVDLIKHSQDHDNPRTSRIVYPVVHHVLSGSDKPHAEQWVQILRKMEKQAPESSLAILFAVAQSGLEPTRLDRYRNELAAELTGVPPSKAATTGLKYLRRLHMTIPNPDSDVAFLPQPRAVNLVKSFQKWVADADDDDEDGVNEEVESVMTDIFVALAPILQNVSGSHWDFMFDVVENNLENCSLAEEETLTLLARSLRFVSTILELVTSNKQLKAVWNERQSAVLVLIRNIVAMRLPADKKASVPLSTCRELALSIVQDLPASLIQQDTLQSMCHLVMDPSTDVQKMSYQLLQEAARKRTEFLVVEAGVDTEGTFKAELPQELVILLSSVAGGDGPEEQNRFGYLLAWMLAFDLFTDASLRVKAGYIEQLRDLDIVASRLLPAIFELLQVYSGLPKAFKLGMWAVENYYVDLYDPSTHISLQVLAAHVYYRALLVVPSLIRTWVNDCKDRTLSRTITTYTSTHFSPVLLEAELTHIKESKAASDIVDENLTIKVAKSVNEVTASFAVDEHQLELTLKLPSDWPLHGVEIKDEKRIGVLEDRWRSWVLGVFALSQNGSIIEGLRLFMKNVAGHFEGQVECAICYSVISPLDGSLPRKPCRTCKNKFHAGCLYKWFNSSHSSSCPLCRSDIF